MVFIHLVYECAPGLMLNGKLMRARRYPENGALNQDANYRIGYNSGK